MLHFTGNILYRLKWFPEKRFEDHINLIKIIRYKQMHLRPVGSFQYVFHDIASYSSHFEGSEPL